MTRRTSTAIVLVWTFVAAAGCEPYARARLGLTEQVARGLDLAGEQLRSQAAMIQLHDADRRQRLDDAFAADLAERPGLDAAWVLEGAAAYADAAVAIEQDRAARAQAAERAADNLDAARDALDRLQILDRLQLQSTLTPDSE